MEGAVDKVIEALKPVAEKLGEGAEFLYGVYFRQTLVEGILQIIIPLILIVAVWIGYKYWYRFCKTNDKRNRDSKTWAYGGEWLGMGIVGVGLALAFATAIGIGVIVQGALKVGNPHFYTIQRIIDNVKAKDVQ